MTEAIETGIISATHLGPEDHGILTAMITIRGESWGQGFGGYDLRVDGVAVKWLSGILSTLEKDKWEDLRNTPVRVFREAGRIIKLGHFYKEKWFTP